MIHGRCGGIVFNSENYYHRRAEEGLWVQPEAVGIGLTGFTQKPTVGKNPRHQDN